MKTLSIRQPWASLIVLGVKRIENRSWQTHFRGRLAIHAAARPADGDGLDLPLGAIVGTVELLDCLPFEDLPPDLRHDPHAQGPWCWILANPRPLATPIAAKGKRGLWDVDLPPERTRVVNVRHAPAGSYLYVGRPMRRHKNPAIRVGSIWGNPFKQGRTSEILKKYRDYVLATPELKSQLHTLRGQVLGCWCHPKPCHADVLAELADGPLGLPQAAKAIELT